MTKKKLTDKQKMFVKEYLIDKNGTQAMIRAGFSEKTAAETAYEYLRKPHIAEAIQKELDKLAEKAEFTAQDVLETIKDIVVANKDNNPQVALKGCELYGKHLKLFTDKIEHTGKDGQELKWQVEIVKPKDKDA